MRVGGDLMKHLEPAAFGPSFHGVMDAPLSRLLGSSFNWSTAVDGERAACDGTSFDEPGLSETDVRYTPSSKIPRFALPGALARELQVRARACAGANKITIK